MAPITFPWKTYYFYRNRLDPKHRKVYDDIFEGLRNWRTEIPMPLGWTIEQVYDIYTMVMRDCPLFFHASVGIRMTTGFAPKLIPQYLINERQYRDLSRQVHDFVIQSKGKLEGILPYQQVKSIHNSIVRHVIYYGIDEPDSHNVIGTILKRRSVCESIAKAFKLICDASLIPCIVVFGRSDSTDGTEYGTVSDDSTEDNHAWNKVRIGQNWYNVDVTFDLGAAEGLGKGTIRYDYFCRSDAVFNQNHRPTGTFLPTCPKDHSVYRAKGIYAKNVSDVVKIVSDHLTSGREEVIFEYDRQANIDFDAINPALSLALMNSPYVSYQGAINEQMGVMSMRFSKSPVPQTPQQPQQRPNPHRRPRVAGNRNMEP